MRLTESQAWILLKDANIFTKKFFQETLTVHSSRKNKLGLYERSYMSEFEKL